MLQTTEDFYSVLYNLIHVYPQRPTKKKQQLYKLLVSCSDC